MDRQRGIFVTGALDRGVDEKTAQEVFDMMAKFAGYGFNKCIVGETEVFDADSGQRHTVKELFDRGARIRVHALDDDQKLTPRQVRDVVWNGVKPVFEVKTRLGNRIVATGNHPLKTFEGWTLVDDLKPGTRVAAPRTLKFEGTATWSRHELITLAHLISEGNTCHPSSLYFYNNSPELVDDFARSAERFPRTVARVRTRKGGRLEVCANTGHDTRFVKGQPAWNAGGVKVKPTAVRSGIWHWANGLGIINQTATEKHVPPAVFKLRTDNIALFLGRLWSGDGHLSSPSSASPYYATSSHRLARDVQHLLLRLGIVSRITEKAFKYRGTTKTGWTVRPQGSDVLRRFLEALGPHIVGRDESLERLREHVRGSGRRMSSSGWHLESEKLTEVAFSDVYWDEVVSITPLGMQDTYDLEVEEDLNFVADGLVVHNSHSAAYSVVAYQTAYLKANYPAEFMAAALTNEMSDTKKLSVVLDEARHLGIEILPPSVNKSLSQFSVEDGA
ncbi:MAG: DNA polymerase III alpha subunit, partial [Rhodothermales bacterium]|nr:DNA polymerase III alpha subunit [Rhodothermales bacterium]